MSEASRSPEDIERTAERRRAEVRDTVTQIKHTLSPEAMSDSAADYIRGPGGRRLISAVRDNPLAAVLAVTGIGWLLYTAGQKEEREARLRGDDLLRDDDLLRADELRDDLRRDEAYAAEGYRGTGPDARSTFPARPVTTVPGTGAARL